MKILIKEKYTLDFLKFVQFTLNYKIETNKETSDWNIKNPITKEVIGYYKPSNGMIQIFTYEMYEIMINYLQLGFGHDVFVL